MLLGATDAQIETVSFGKEKPSAVGYVGSDAGVFRTADGGATWALRSRGLVRRGLSGLAISTSAPSDLLLATTAGTPYVSRTGGERWTSTGVGLSGFEVLLPVISSADPDLFLIQAELKGLFRSTDRGVTCTQVTSDDDCTFCWAVQAVDADPFDADVVVIGVAGRDLYRSTDRGETWAPVALELGKRREGHHLRPRSPARGTGLPPCTRSSCPQCMLKFMSLNKVRSPRAQLRS